METVHNTQNLTIRYDREKRLYHLTVCFDEEAISGEAPGVCPRCGGVTRLSLWELEGPGSNANTIWLVCAEDKPCQLDGHALRWAKDVVFDGDWQDV